MFSIGHFPLRGVGSTRQGRPMLAVMLAVLVLLGPGSAAAVAQSGTPAPEHGHEVAATPPPGSGVTTEVLGRGLPSDSPDQALALMRVTFEPGAAAGAHSHPGATVYHIESGSLVFTLVEGDAMLMRAGTMATPDAAETIEPGTEIVLNAGDTVFYEGDAVQTEVNNGDEPAVILIANIRGADEPARQPAGTPAT